MSNTTDKNNSKPTLTIKKLTLGQSGNINKIKNSIIQSKNNIVVEVKKNPLRASLELNKALLKKIEHNDKVTQKINTDEEQRKIEKMKQKLNVHHVTTLTQLMEANNSAQKEEIKRKEEKINNTLVQQQKVEEQKSEIKADLNTMERKEEKISEIPVELKKVKEQKIEENANNFARNKQQIVETSAQNFKSHGAKKNNSFRQNKFNKSTTTNNEDENHYTPKNKHEHGHRNTKLNKSHLIYMLENDSSESDLHEDIPSRPRYRKKRDKKFVHTAQKISQEISIGKSISISKLAHEIGQKSQYVIRELEKLGLDPANNELIDQDAAELIISHFGHRIKRISKKTINDILNIKTETADNLVPRAPVVTVMGHVDHGKTSLLDALRLTDVTTQEFGGITQHIGAYSVTLPSGKMITFIDTPGHATFTQMRTRGAKITDIVVLVVAADDGIREQTIEAIAHAKAAKVPIIVALNKIDKSGINIDKIKNDLLVNDLIPEDLGGDVIVVPISAKKKENLDKLEEAILLVADLKELTANPNGRTFGVIIESKITRQKGVIATVLIQNGTLKKGDLVVSGYNCSRIKLINDDKAKQINHAGPSCIAEIYGLESPPIAGEIFYVVDNEKQARDLIQCKQDENNELEEPQIKVSPQDLFNKMSKDAGQQILSIIIKGDVYGSVEAIANTIDKMNEMSDEFKIKILHKSVGDITSSDVSLAQTSNATILAFNVSIPGNIKLLTERNNVPIKEYSVIYHLVDDIKDILSGMLPPIIHKDLIGSLLVQEVFDISKFGKVAGCIVKKGLIKRNSTASVVRNGKTIYEGKIRNLKRFKEDVKEVKEGSECGLSFSNYDNFEVNDIIEVFKIIEERRKL